MVPKYTKMNDLLTPQKDAAAPLLPRWMGVLPSSPGWFACAPRQHPRRDTIEWRSVQARARPSCRRWLALFGCLVELELILWKKWVIFHSYVSLPENRPRKFTFFSWKLIFQPLSARVHVNLLEGTRIM